MNEKLAQYRGRVAQYWNQFSKKQKWMLIGTLSFVIIALGILTYQLSKTEYEIAFKDLNSSDAAGIIEYLNTNGIAYQLSADGSAISVPSASASKVKVDVGAQGLVKNGSIGFDSFGDTSLMSGMTDNVFDVRYKDALNGEIERLLRQMQGVKDAQVLVNLPKETVFAVESQPEASASVILSFEPGFTPKQQVIDGYFNLIKSAVPNLPVEQITLASNEGPLYASGSSEASGGALTGKVEEQLAIQRRYERDLSDKVRSFMASAGGIGIDKVNVLVSANLNFDKVNKEENLVTPVDTENMKGIEISVQELQESLTGQGTQQGVAGAGVEDVTNYPGTADNGTTSSEKSQRTVNYEVNRIKNLIESSPYALEDLTIHTAVDSDKLTADNIAALEKVLRSIVSAQLNTNGTTITDAELETKVSVISQNGTEVGAATATSIPSWVWYGAGALALLLIGGVVAFAVARNRKRKQDEYYMNEDEPYSPTITELPSIDLDYASSENQVRKQLETLAKKKPEEFVNLLRTWLTDESR